jgi:hypothetical protein
MIKNHHSFLKIMLNLGFALFISSCTKDKIVDPVVEEAEIITTAKLIFTENGNVQTFTFSDPDGDGGKSPVKFDQIKLKANTKYTLDIELLDESKNPIENITSEIEAEKDEHLFVFTPSSSNILTYKYLDKDANNFNVGLKGEVTTGAKNTGKLKVQLRHQPPVNNKPTKDGTATPGSDDINLDFDIIIE